MQVRPAFCPQTVFCIFLSQVPYNLIWLLYSNSSPFFYFRSNVHIPLQSIQRIPFRVTNLVSHFLSLVNFPKWDYTFIFNLRVLVLLFVLIEIPQLPKSHLTIKASETSCMKLLLSSASLPNKTFLVFSCHS